MGADGDAPAPADHGGRESPPPVLPTQLDSVAPPPGAPGEAGSSGVGQDDVPVLPMPQRQVGFYLGGAGRQVLGNGRGGDVRDAARLGAQLPGGDPVDGDVYRDLQVDVYQEDLQVLPEQHTIRDGVYHQEDLQVLPEHADREPVADEHEGVGVGGDDIAPDALPQVGRRGNGIGEGIDAGRGALPPLGRGRGGNGIGQGLGAGRVALPPLGHGRGRGVKQPRVPSVVDLYGPDTNRPDAKGKTVPRLDRKFHSQDDQITAMNYQLRKLFVQLQERKLDAREADQVSGRKAALTISKEYAKGLRRAEGLRRQILRARGVPVEKPKNLPKDPLA